MNGLFLSSETLKSADADLRSSIFALAGFSLPAQPEAEVPGDIPATGSAYGMNNEFALDFLTKCSPKTRKTLVTICSLNGVFHYDDIEGRVGLGSLRGVWTGITNRLRKLTDEPKAVLFEWEWDEDRGDWTGKLHPATLAALKAALN